MVSYEGHQYQQRVGTGHHRQWELLPATPMEHMGSKLSHRSSLEANLMTSAHFFQTHTPPPHRPPSAPCLPKSQCLWITSLWRGQGRPESPGGAPSRGCSVSALPAWPASWDIRQRNHTTCCCLGEHQSGFPWQQPLEPVVRCRQLTAQGQASPASSGHRGKRSTLVSEVRKARPGDLRDLPAQGEQDECLGG